MSAVVNVDASPVDATQGAAPAGVSGAEPTGDELSPEARCLRACGFSGGPADGHEQREPHRTL